MGLVGRHLPVGEGTSEGVWEGYVREEPEVRVSAEVG